MAEVRSSIPIPMFNGDNYESWSIKMMTYLRAHKLWDVVSNGCTVPDDFSTLTVAEKEKLLEKNQQRDSSALLALQSCLTDKYFSRIKAAETSKEAWDILKEDFHENKKECLILGPDPFAAASKKEHSTSVMEFNVGANFPIKENRKPKSKNKIRNKERQNAAAADPKNNTPPGRDRKRGRAHVSDPKDISSNSKKRAHDSDSEDDSSSPKKRNR